MNLVSSIARSEGRLKVNHLSQLLQAQEASIKDYLKFSASQPSSQDVGNPAQQPPPYVIEEGVDSPELHQADADDEEEREVMSYSSDIDEQSDAIQDEHEDYDEKDENEGVGESEDSEENEEIDDEEDVDEHDEEYDEEEELDYGEGDREGLEGEEEDSNEELTEEEEDFHDDEEDQDEAVEIPACVVFGGAPSDLLVHLLVSPPPKQDQVAVVMEDAGTSSTASVLPDAQTIQQGEHDRSPPCLPLMATKASDAVEAEYTTSAMNAEPRSMVVDGVKEWQLPCNVIAADHGSSEEQPSATDVVEFATENAPPMPETPSRCQLAENPVYGRTPSISDASSEGPVTPPTTSHKRHLRADFDVEVHGNQPVNAATRPRKVRKLTSTLGLIALGAALGSVGTIAGLMQVPL